jgi:hypothetical protein
MAEIAGTFNGSADNVTRKNETWSDTNLTSIFYAKSDEFIRLKCHCGGLSFEVLVTGAYETSAKCTKCMRYYIVHTG